jgi:hypothetical protein
MDLTWEFLVVLTPGVSAEQLRDLLASFSLPVTETISGDFRYYHFECTGSRALEVQAALPSGATIQFGGIWAGWPPEVTREFFEAWDRSEARTREIRAKFAQLASLYPQLPARGTEESVVASKAFLPARSALEEVLEAHGGRLAFHDAVLQAYARCSDYPAVGRDTFENVVISISNFTLEGDDLVCAPSPRASGSHSSLLHRVKRFFSGILRRLRGHD